VTRWPGISAFLLLACAIATTAHAQEGNRFALGGSYTHRGVPSPSAHGGQGPGIQWRFGHATEGWGWHYGLNWYSTDVDRNIGGHPTHLGEMRVRPFMGGYGYTHVMGPMALTASAIGGYSFTGLDLTREATDAYFDRLGARSVSVHTSGIPVVKPEIELWYDLGKKIGLTANIGYIVARPRMTITTSVGSETERFRADAWSMTAGAVYRIF
jgi:hypothetical protein